MKCKIVIIGFVSLLIGWSSKAYSILKDKTNMNHPNEVMMSSIRHSYPNVKWSAEAFVKQDTIISRKVRRRIKKQERKKMYKDLKFKIGNGVTVITGPMKDMYGVVIYYDKKMKYLIRFTGTQQMFFAEEEIILWDK